MPQIWLTLLLQEGTDINECLWNLKNKYTVADVYDMVEVLDAKSALYEDKMRKEKANATNR